jgi:hypothetical protein
VNQFIAHCKVLIMEGQLRHRSPENRIEIQAAAGRRERCR